MKVYVLTILAVSTFVGGAVINEPAFNGFNYHEKVGIPAAARIKAAEEAFNAGITIRIVGGHAATLGQFPYHAGLVTITHQGLTSICGATLVSNTKLVTAAHCWTTGEVNARQFTVVLGSLTLFSGGQRIVTSDVITHEHYDPWTINNDVAVITIPWIQFNTNIKAISLARGEDTFDQALAVASGFGMTGTNIPVQPNQFLSYVRVPVISNVECGRVFPSTIVRESTLCTSGAGGRGICMGDSGGPVVTTVNNERVLIGIISFGSAEGCESGAPSGHVRITSFYDWFQQRL